MPWPLLHLWRFKTRWSYVSATGSGCIAANTNLSEHIIFLIVALNCRDGFAWATYTNAHFDHLAIEEVGKVLLIDVGCDAADIEAPGLPRQVRVAAYAHCECLNGNWGQETWNTENQWNLSTVSTRAIKETCRFIVR